MTQRTLMKNMTVHGRLFQAAMWRKYAMEWDACKTYSVGWLENVLRVSREECLRRARINVRLARRLNRMERMNRCHSSPTN